MRAYKKVSERYSFTDVSGIVIAPKKFGPSWKANWIDGLS